MPGRYLHVFLVEVLINQVVGIIVPCSAGVQESASAALLLKVGQQQLPVSPGFPPLPCSSQHPSPTAQEEDHLCNDGITDTSA